jgi:hypothetical protein
MTLARSRRSHPTLGGADRSQGPAVLVAAFPLALAVPLLALIASRRRASTRERPVTPRRRRGPGQRSRSAVLAVVAAAGLLAASLALAACQWPTGEVGAKAAEPPTGKTARVVARASRPVSIAVPAAGVDARVVPVGLGTDGAMEVPEVDLAGWYRLGPRPGERGPAVIVATSTPARDRPCSSGWASSAMATGSWSGRTGERRSRSRSSGSSATPRSRCRSSASGTAPASRCCG